LRLGALRGSGKAQSALQGRNLGGDEWRIDALHLELHNHCGRDTFRVRSIFVISDLHLGGRYPVPPERRGFRLCTHADAIAQFIALRTREIADGPVEIVLNGDAVDFLAETDGEKAETWSSFTVDPQAALRKFRKIVERDKCVFDAFADFLHAGGRLTVLLGNHDIELSLPVVRREFRNALGVKTGHDFEFFYDNEAYVIGDVLIEHGNRYDAWNQVDYDILRRIRSSQSRRQSLPAAATFVAPPGSDMVTSVMNTIKRDYAFIDLLKPETSAAVPVLLALEPGYRSRLAAIALLYKRTRSHGLIAPTTPRWGGDVRSDRSIEVIPGGDMGGPGAPRTAARADPARATSAAGPERGSELEQALKDALEEAFGSEAEARDFLHDIHQQMVEIDPSLDIGGAISAFDMPSSIFGFVGLVFGKTAVPYQKRLPALLKALRPLQDSHAFDPEKETATEYLEAATKLADEGHFRYVIFGHTHLAKRVSLGDGRTYFNSGTWADVLQFPPEIFAPGGDPLTRLTGFVEKLKAGDFSGWTLFRPTYVRLEVDADDQVTKAELETFSELPT
jgi:UDP-2,3-diacylglucosamine pyrophosphatase LpxH